MNQILNHTTSHFYNWGNEIKNYEVNKKILAWGQNIKPEKITHREIKIRDNIFNPILQIYRNKDSENFIKVKEQQDIINTLSANKDRALAVEQTFNILNLENKLLGLENNTKFPKSKSENPMRKKLENSKTNFNILSNINLDKHSYLKPEDRIEIKENLNKTGVEFHRIKIMKNDKDFDIISNKYYENNEKKLRAETAISKLTLAKKYWKTHDYDPVQAKYIDSEKEKKYQEEKEAKINNQQLKLKRIVHGTGELYNPINMSAIHNEELKYRDAKIKFKKKRFDIRYAVEDYQHSLSLRDQEKEKNNQIKKISYKRVEEQNNRGFDIIDNNDRDAVKLKQVDHQGLTRGRLSDWEKLIAFSGDKNTFKFKEIYKNPYDYTELDKNSHLFNTKRKSRFFILFLELLESLPEIKHDKNFPHQIKGKNIPSKIEKVNDSRNEFNTIQPAEIDKEKWFKTQSQHFYDPIKVEKVDYHELVLFDLFF